MTIVNAGVDRVARKIANELLDDRYKSKSPRGFLDRTKSVLSYNTGTRTVTLTPNGFCLVYVNGYRVVLDSPISVVHPNTVGTHFITIDESGALVASMTPWDLLSSQPVAIVYWNGSTGWLGDERHGKMNAATHAYLHQTIGARWSSGLAVLGTVTDSGAPTTDQQSQIVVTGGEFYDEDIRFTIGARGSLSPFIPAQIPQLHWSGTAWVTSPITNWPFTVGANNRPQYQNPSGGLLQAGNNRFTVHWIFALNFSGLELVSIPHPAEFTTLALAQAASADSLNLAGLPTQEIVLLGRIILETRDTYTAPSRKAVTRRLDDFRRALGPVAQAPVPVSHSALSGLSANDHPQYVMHGESRQTFVATAGQTVFNLDFSYNAGDLMVFVDGVLQEASVDYNETSETSITFTTGLPAGTRVRVFRM